jgi:hypothetical protein
MIQQIREGVSYAEIEEQILQGRVSVEPTRIVVRQFEPTTLRVALLDKRLQGRVVPGGHRASVAPSTRARRVQLLLAHTRPTYSGACTSSVFDRCHLSRDSWSPKDLKERAKTSPD